jgi:hypothetical protein
MTAASQQGLPPAPILLKTIIVDQKSSLGRICWKSVGRDFIIRDANPTQRKRGVYSKKK